MSKLMGRWSLCFPQLAGECKARQTPAVQNTKSSWDGVPRSTVEESVKPQTATSEG